jgi:hypothetical protein
MPGRIATDIITNSQKILAGDEMAIDVSAERKRFAARGIDVTSLSDDQIRIRVTDFAKRFRDDAPISAADAATIILDGVKADRWRILVGKAAEFLDDRIRSAPDGAYSPTFYEEFLKKAQAGEFQG